MTPTDRFPDPLDFTDPTDPLAAGLAALATNGPPGLLERIAARWCRVPGPTCDLYVASTDRGVAYVRTSDAVHNNAAEFAALFHHRFTTPLVAAPHPPTDLHSPTPPTLKPPITPLPTAHLPTTPQAIPEPPTIPDLSAAPHPPSARPQAARQPCPQPLTTPTAGRPAIQPSTAARSAPPPSAELAPNPRPTSDHAARIRFDLSRLPAFDREVLLAVLTIPRGQVRPHAWVAHQIGRPTAAHAVDTALAHSPVPVLIPCHRVINADGTLGNHVFGPAVKRALLDAEDANVGEVYQLAQLDIHYVANDIVGVVCFPTCPNARRTEHAHRHGFPTVAHAEDAGYRPCPTCRPVSDEVG
jgi:O-6-methylguanine DNA methyltransferase